jgi:hypothetical protein
MSATTLRRALLSLLLVSTAACASAGASGSNHRITPPKVRGNTHPDFAMIGPPARAETRTDFSVMVDPDGQPDMKTFRAMGSGAAALGDAIRRWIETSSFEPGLENGTPVRAEYHSTIMTKVVRR